MAYKKFPVYLIGRYCNCLDCLKEGSESYHIVSSLSYRILKKSGKSVHLRFARLF